MPWHETCQSQTHYYLPSPKPVPNRPIVLSSIDNQQNMQKKGVVLSETKRPLKSIFKLKSSFGKNLKHAVSPENAGLLKSENVWARPAPGSGCDNSSPIVILTKDLYGFQ